MEGRNNVIAVSELDSSFCEEVASQPGGENVRRCFACGTCAAGCPITEIDERYNCRKIVRQILFGMREEVLSSPTIWYCLVCYRCYARCPQKVNFTDIMRILRYLAVKGHYVSPDTLSKVEQLDRFAQILRRDLMDYTFTPEKEIAQRIQEEVAQRLR